jgi:hypothetical protein
MVAAPICGPATPHQGDPHEELALQRRLGLAQFFGARNTTLTLEKWAIGRQHQILLVRQPFPNKLIYRLIIELDGLELDP